MILTPEEELRKGRKQWPLGYWPLTKHHIERCGFFYVVWQGRRYVGKTRRYLKALGLVQESGGR